MQESGVFTYKFSKIDVLPCRQGPGCGQATGDGMASR
jgi:hypothetical protein